MITNIIYVFVYKMHVIVARCLQTQSILNRLTIEQWSTIEKVRSLLRHQVSYSMKVDYLGFMHV